MNAFPSNEQIPESESLLFMYLNVLKKRGPVVISFAGVLIITAIIATMFSTRYYSSRSVIEIMPIAPSVMGKESGEAVSELGAATDSALRVYYGTQFSILSSATVLSRSVERLQQDHGVTDFDEMEEPAKFLRTHLTLAPQPDTTLVHIKIEYPDPNKAALFANVIADVYMQYNLERGLTAVKEALTWLEREHERYREAKLEADEKVHEFKYENHLVGIEQRANVTMAKMQQLQLILTNIQTERIQVEAEYKQRLRMSQSDAWTALAKEYSVSDRLLSSLMNSRSQLLQNRDELASRYLPAHPKMASIQKQLDAIELRIKEEVGKHLMAKQASLDIVFSKENVVREELQMIESEVKELDRKLIELQFLTGEAARNEKLYLMLDKRMSEVDLSQFMQSNNIRFVDQAVPNDVPVRPNFALNLFMAIILGAIGGIGLAFIVEYLDNTVKTKDDLEFMLGVPLLGVVPSIDSEEMLAISSNRERSLFAHSRPRSPVSESLRSIRTNVLFRTGNVPSRTLLVTSAVPKEGKSFMSANLAAVLAMAGSRVILIDADLRRPSTHLLFDLSDDQGLSEVLAGTRSIDEVIQQSHVPNLEVISSGPIPPNPSELLGSDEMKRIPELLSERYDIIIIDSPPATAVADPIVLAPLADGVVLVVEANRTRKPVVMQAITRLQQVQAKIIGGIVNKLDVRKSGYGYYYYYSNYGYYADEEYEERISS